MSSTILNDSLVLVTGANGFLGSNIAEAFLSAGYRVRGTARSVSKLANLKARWENQFGAERFEMAVVEDMAIEGAFDQAMKGVWGVAHVASALPMGTLPATVIDPVINGTHSILRSAHREPTVKSFVLTSSSTAAVWPKANIAYDVGEDSWNEESLKKAYDLPESDPAKTYHIYAASKTLGEQAAWKFYTQEKPGFVLNAILPNTNFGPMLDPDIGSTALLLKKAFQGDMRALNSLPAQWFVDVRDTAMLHVLALTSPKLASGGARVWAVAATYHTDEILQTFRRLYPERSFPADTGSTRRDLSRVDNRRGTELLGKWRSLEEALKANTEGL